MSSVLQEQEGLLAALFGTGDAGALWPQLKTGSHAALARRGLQAYQSNGLALAGRALGAAYPVIAQLLGQENFAPLARHFWRQQPPVRGDLAWWGDGLTAFVESAEQLADEPFLSDVARVEWALHCAATAPDGSPDVQSLVLLSRDNDASGAQPTLTLAPGVFVLASNWPVASLVNAHLVGEPTLAQAADLLHARVGEYAVVWRDGFKPRLCSATAAGHALLHTLVRQHPLDEAVQMAVSVSPSFDFGDWLADAVGSGLVVGAHLQPADRPVFS